ncbi:hypothetical protein DSECCO2_257830 [anaerobic digester metagenome]
MEDEAEFAIMLSGIIDEEENLESEKIMYTCYYVWRLFRKYSEKKLRQLQQAYNLAMSCVNNNDMVQAHWLLGGSVLPSSINQK